MKRGKRREKQRGREKEGEKDKRKIYTSYCEEEIEWFTNGI